MHGNIQFPSRKSKISIKYYHRGLQNGSGGLIYIRA